MNQDTYGDFLRYEESPGMTFDTTRCHRTQFQKVESHRNLKILTKSSRGSVFRAQILNLRWTQVEYSSKIIIIDVENYSFGYNLTSEIWMSEGPDPLAGGCLDLWNLPPGGECFAPFCIKPCYAANIYDAWVGCHELLWQLYLIPEDGFSWVSFKCDPWILSTWVTHLADERGCEALSPPLRSPEINQKLWLVEQAL